MQQTLRHGMGFCPGAPHGTKGTIVSMIRVVGPMGALQEGARPVVAKLNLSASVASRSMTGFHPTEPIPTSIANGKYGARKSRSEREAE
jgi:hypothetical protein